MHMLLLPVEARYAIRSCFAHRLVSAAIILIVAVAIGGVTAIGAVVKRVLLDPLPFEQPERLVRISMTDPATGRIQAARFGDFQAWQQAIKGMTLAAFSGGRPTLQRADIAEAFDVGYVGPGFDRVLRVATQLGRFFNDEEFERGTDAVLVLTDSAWRRLFNGDPGAVGRSLTIDNRAYTIVGVLPATSFDYPRTPFGLDAWLPLVRFGAAEAGRSIQVVGRLAEDVGSAEVQEGLAASFAAQAADRPANARNLRPTVAPLQEEAAAGPRPALLLVLGALVVVLLIASVNIANLLLARGEERRRDLSIMAAVGLDRLVIARLLLMENLLLTFAGAALGAALAPWLIQTFLAVYPDPLPRPVDGRAILSVLPITVGLTVLTAVLASLPLLLSTVRGVTGTDLRASERTATASPARLRLRATLVIAQLALSLVLLSAATQLTRSFLALVRVQPGYDETVMAFAMGMVQRDRSADRAIQFYRDLLDALGRQPGIVSAAATNNLPTRNAPPAAVRFLGPEVRPRPEGAPVFANLVTPAYLRVLDIGLVRGRDLSETDDAASPRVTLINQRLATEAYGTLDVIGRQLEWAGETWEVVGVVSDIRQRGPAQPPDPAFYVSWKQRREPPLFVLVRSTLSADALAGAIRAALGEADKNRIAPIHTMATLADRSAELTRRDRFNAVTTTTISIVALVLVILGIYGNLAYAVTQRRREIAIRLALGATRPQVEGGFVRYASIQAAIGAGVGILCTVWSGRWLEASLAGFTAGDAGSSAFVAALLVGLATFAAWMPARRAGRIDPASLLRGE